MWKLFATGLYEPVARWYARKKANEQKAVERNLEKCLKMLNHGTKPLQLPSLKYVHDEGKGVLAIDESGYKVKTQVTRLYIWCDEAAGLVHLITIGDKHSQRDDIQLAHEYVAEQQRKANEAHESDPGTETQAPEDGA
jgi:hypothetical protein